EPTQARPALLHLTQEQIPATQIVLGPGRPLPTDRGELTGHPLLHALHRRSTAPTGRARTARERTRSLRLGQTHRRHHPQPGLAPHDPTHRDRQGQRRLTTHSTGPAPKHTPRT